MPECWCDVSTEPTCNVSCAQLKEHGQAMAERDRYREALRILRVSADFHQRNIIDKALDDEQ